MNELEKKKITRGDNAYIQLTFTETSEESPVAFALDIFDNIICHFREGAAAYAEKIIGKSLGEGIAIEGEQDNILVITLSAEDTNAFDEGIYVFDIRFYVGESVKTKLTGLLEVEANISEI